MGSCLNSLEKDVVFIPIAALLALVLLVWTQLGAPKDKEVLDRDMNLWFGLMWTYAAIFFALIAVALFVFNETNDCAKGFLILSFLMTIANILMAVGLNFIKIVFKRPFGESLTNVCANSGLLAEGWFLFWLFLLFGLIFISFSLVNKLGGLYSPFFWAGVVLIGVAVLRALVRICCGFNWWFLCIRLRWKCWETLRRCVKYLKDCFKKQGAND